MEIPRFLQDLVCQGPWHVNTVKQVPPLRRGKKRSQRRQQQHPRHHHQRPDSLDREAHG
jgi:hypothetical protein